MGKHAYLPLSNQFKKTPDQLEENKNSLMAKIILDENGIAKVSINKDYSGTYKTYARKNYRKLPGIQYQYNLTKRIYNLFPGLDIDNILITGMDKIDEEVRIDISLLREENPSKQEKLFALQPLKLWPETEINKIKDLFKPKERLYPLDMEIRHNFVRQVEVALPEGFRLVNLPGQMFMENKIGMLKVDYEQIENKVTVDFQLKFNEKEIEPEDYYLAQELINRADYIINNESLLIVK